MSNISSALLSTSEASLGGQFLEIEQTEGALVSWLQKQAREILPEPLFTTASVLFAWVDLYDLRAVLEVSLSVVAMETQFHRETHTVSHLRASRYLMEERMYRAQMEVSLFGKALVNLCEEMNARYHVASNSDLKILKTDTVRYMGACQAPSSVNLHHRFRPTVAVQEKCNAWLLKLSRPQHTIQVSNCSGTFLDSWVTLEVPQLHEPLLSPNERLSLPHLVKAWVDDVTYRAYTNASLEEFNEPLGINNCENFKAKEYKTQDALTSDLQILFLKRHRAQAEVKMFCEAIERTSELGSADGAGQTAFVYGKMTVGTTSGISMTYESRPPANDYQNDSFDDSCSTLSISSTL